MLYLYLSGSTFLISITAPNKELPSVKSLSKCFDHVFNLYQIYKFTIFLWRKHAVFLFQTDSF